MTDTLATHITAASNAAKNLDPASVVAAAQAANSPTEAVGNAQATAQYGNVTTLANTLGGLGIKQQHTVWGSLTSQQQQQLNSVGYQLPPDPSVMHKSAGPTGISGLFTDVAHGLGAIGSGLSRAGGDVLNALSSPLRAFQHVVRAADYNSEQAALGQGVSARSIGHAGFAPPSQGWWNPFSPSAWARGWRATTNGNTTFSPAALRLLNSQHDPASMHLAEQLASGVPEDELVNGLPASQRQAVVTQLQSPEMKQLVTQLNAAHISLGKVAVGEQFLVQHPEAGKLISGAIDGSFDLAADPAMHTGSLVKAVDVARWGLDASRAAEYVAPDATAYEAMLAKPAAQRMIQVAGNALGSGDVGKVTTMFPTTLGKVAHQLAADGVDSPEALHDWLTSQAGMKAVLTGDAARKTAGVSIMPHLSTLAWGKATVKAALQSGLDKLIDNPKGLSDINLSRDMVAGLGGPDLVTMHALGEIPTNLGDLAKDRTGGAIASAVRGGASKVARMVRNMSTFVPTKPYLDLADPNSGQQLERALLYSLPRNVVNRITYVYDTTADPNQRFLIAKGAIAQMLQMAGVPTTDEGAKAADGILASMDDSYRHSAYSVGGIDQFEDGSRAGILENQLSTRIHLPRLDEVHDAVRADNFLGRMGITIPGSATASALMNGTRHAAAAFMAKWRPLVLARIGFPLRVSLDENLNYALRNGVMPMVAARVALHGLKLGGKRAAVDALRAGEENLPDDVRGMGKAIATIASHVPPAVLKAVRTPRDLAAATFGEAGWKALGKTTGLSRDEWYHAAGLFHAHEWDAMSPLVSAVHHAGGGYDEADDLLNMMVDGSPRALRWAKSGQYSEATAADPLWQYKYHQALSTVGESRLGRAVLEHIDQDPRTQTSHVLKIIQGDDFADERRMAVRNMKLPDGRIVGVDATQDEAHRAWARKVVAHINALVRSSDPKNGPVLHNVVDEMLGNEGAPAFDTVQNIAHHDLPKSVYGPDVVPVAPLTHILSKGMNGLAGMMDMLARQPNALAAYARQLKTLKPWVEKLIPDAGEEQDHLLSNLAAHHAANELKPFIHSPEIKSQFEVLHRTAAPFLFAQRQFLQRWGRTFLDSPDAIRKAQLTMNGLRTSGIVQKDSAGNDFFYYPGTATVTKFLSDTLNHIGIPASLPISVPFTGELKYIMPGLSNPLTPSVGPFVALPLKAITQIEPAFQPVEQAALQQGASNAYWEQVLPTTLSRLINTFASQPAAGGQFASSMMKAIQDAEATGHGLPANATATQKQAWLDRIQNWARINMFMTAVLGFVAPASPAQNFDPKNLNPRLSTLMNELPYDQAVTEFLKENPDATPYTVFMSTSAGGGVLPASAAAGTFLDANQNFIRAHPQAAGWFIPRTTGNAPYDAAVYREQIQTGLRNEKTPSDFLNDVLMAPAASVYYTSYDNKQAAILAAGTNTAAKTQIRNSWANWEALFLAQNPTYADYLSSGGNAVKRESTIRDINAALSDPTTPQGPQTDNIRTLMTSFDNFEQAYLAIDGNYSSAATTTKNNLEDSFIAWGASVATAEPDVADLWNLLIRPEATSIASGYAYPIDSLVNTAAS